MCNDEAGLLASISFPYYPKLKKKVVSPLPSTPAQLSFKPALISCFTGAFQDGKQGD